ncbi:Uncharacterised protein [Legionella busanensis]|uniref:Uncharacterized protein n=1 Tax=Legionella busanensis TaxID=190655 RepID=A0A378JJR5_9GAMM|nr:hypothetical protein [Legionella busanensis]STX50938.1 Uncharacterised protein [Legionella busanensis]
MNYFKTCFNKYLASLALLVLLVCLSLLIKNEGEIITKKINITNIILNDIQSQLSSIHQELRQPHKTIDLTPLSQNFNALTTKIEQLKISGENQLSQLLTDNRNEVAQQLKDIHQVVNSLDKKENPVHYLPTSALPFKLLSIDSIQQVSVVSVTYDYKTIPLEKGDTLAGWIVTHIDFGKQCVEFENKDKKRVVVNLDEDRAT